MIHELFRKFSAHVSRVIGSIWSFLVVSILILTTGYFSSFSSEWKNTVSFIISIATLSMLFALQKSQNHGDKATHLELDELIRAIEGARNEVVSVENKAEEHLNELREIIENEIINE